MGLEVAEDQARLFEKEVKHVFQPRAANVRQYARVRTLKGMSSAHFPVLGRSTTTRRENYLSKIPVGNASHDSVIITVQDWTASEHTDIFLQNKVQYDERAELAASIGMALERRMLQVVIDTLAAGNYTNRTVAKNLGGSNQNLTLTQLREAAKMLGRAGVPGDGRALLLHTNNLHSFLGATNVASSDFNKSNVNNAGTLPGYYGFNFLEVGDMPEEGGLPLATNDRSVFAFHKDAIGMLINMEPKIMIDWLGEYGCHKVTGYLSMGVGIIDPTGTVRIVCDESLA